MDDVYKIVRILNDTEIVINAGHLQGLKEGDLLEIFVEGEEIEDPDTRESLGTLDFIKGKVEIKTVYPKMSLCQSAQFRTTKKYPAHIAAIEKITKSYIVTEVEEIKPLNVDLTQAQQTREVDRLIRVGDTIRLCL